jgi:hypothetical protein
MPTGQFNLSLDTDLIARINRIIPRGDRTREISNIISELCDKHESKMAEHKIRKMKFEKYFKPFILKYAKGKDPFYLLEDEGLRAAFKESKITISDADIKLCIEEILMEGE